MKIGTADWHYLRKFSFTSSQANGSFVAAFPEYQDNESWVAVARYLYGEDQWRTKLKVGSCVGTVGTAPREQQQEEGGEDEVSQDNGGGLDRLNPPSIQLYLAEKINEQNNATDDGPLDALEWLKIYVLSNDNGDEAQETGADAATDAESYHGRTVTSEREAANLVNALSPSHRKDILNILFAQVHPDYQSSNNNSKKDLIGWLQKPNCIRNYLFYKANGLKDLMAARKITLTGRCNKEDRIAALAGTVTGSRLIQQPAQRQQQQQPPSCQGNQQLPPKDLAMKKVLEKSFLPFQKGDEREHCSLGHRLEKPILKNWMTIMKNDSESPVPGLVVKGAYTAGLAAKKGASFAKDSIDFILLVKKEQDPFGLAEDLLGQDDELEAWGFEAKGRVTCKTALAEEEQFSSSLFSKHNRIKDSEVFDLVRQVGERFQLLQHAYVYDFDTVVLAVSDAHSEIINSVIIDFTTELKRHFGEVLKEMKSFTLDWMYPDQESRNARRAEVVKIPDRVFKIAKNVASINGDEALQGTANLWKTLSSLPSPFPSFTRLIPSIYAFWNAVKGGSDTTTKLMDDCALFMPFANMETVASARCLMLIVVLLHRLFQIFSANDNLNAYSSLRAYRRAASKRSTFHKTILHCHSVFKSELHSMKDEANKENMYSISRNNLRNGQLQQRILPNRQKVDGVVPESVTFGATLSTCTPKKVTLKVQKGVANEDVHSMVSNCKGIPMKLHVSARPGDRRGKCDKCKTNTPWYCVGCKRWCCLERRGVHNNSKELKLYCHRVKGEKLHFKKSCFHELHEHNWNCTPNEK